MYKIICLVIIVGILALGSTAIAKPPKAPMPFNGEYNNLYITKEGYVAATNEELLDVAIKLALSNDKEQFTNYLIVNPLVFFLRPNLWARLEKRSHPGKVKIKLIDYDLSVWTLREAIE